MSNLALRDDDFPAAAEKMLADARALHYARRYDGAAYLAGYAVEMSLKTVILIETLAHVSGAMTLQDLIRELLTRGTAEALLNFHASATAVARALRTQVRHDTGKALRFALRKTPLTLPLAISGVAQNYVSAHWLRHVTHRNWRETHRYRAPGRVTSKQSRQRLENAETVVQGTITAMRADGRCI